MKANENIYLSEEQRENLKQFKADCYEELSSEDISMLKRLARFSLLLHIMYKEITILVSSFTAPVLIAILHFINYNDFSIFLVAIFVSLGMFMIYTKLIFKNFESESEYQKRFYLIAKKRLKEL